MLRRLHLAWRMYTGLNYSWHVAWHKAANRELNSAPWRAAPTDLRIDPQSQRGRRRDAVKQGRRPTLSVVGN